MMIHITTASFKSKAELIYLIYGREEWQHINADIPKKYWNKVHIPSYVYDSRTKKIVNLMEEGIKRNLIRR